MGALLWAWVYLWITHVTVNAKVVVETHAYEDELLLDPSGDVYRLWTVKVFQNGSIVHDGRQVGLLEKEGTKRRLLFRSLHPQTLHAPGIDKLKSTVCERLHRITYKCRPFMFILSILCSVGLICLAGMMAGLTVGLLSLDKLNLCILQMEGTEEEKKAVGEILPLVEKHHLLLVTLLVLNALANEALPIFLDRLVNPYVAVLFSVTCVLVFGEIIPAAVFTGSRQLIFGAKCVPFVKILMKLVYPISYPISRLLDYILGDEHGCTRYGRNQLKALISLQQQAGALGPLVKTTSLNTSADHDAKTDHQSIDELTTCRTNDSWGSLENGECLHLDEVSIIHGALDLSHKCVQDIMIPFHETFMLSEDVLLDEAGVASILAAGHSRIPIFRKERHDVVGILLVKKLIAVDSSDKRRISDLSLRAPLIVPPHESLYNIFNRFITGRSHLAMIERRGSHAMKREFVGLVTLEDVLEELIQKQIQDESDDCKSISWARSKPITNAVLDPTSIAVNESKKKVKIDQLVHKAVYKFKVLGNRAKDRRKKCPESVNFFDYLPVLQNSPGGALAVAMA